MSTKKEEPQWRPHSWLGDYLGWKKLAECIIVSKIDKPKKGKKK